MKKYIINLFVAATLLIGCNESLEDTYSDYAGNGKIRYVAKCTDVNVISGWERLVLEWQNGTDATIDKIKVVWTCEDRKDSVLLENTVTSYELGDLPDGTYRFDVCAVDAVGNESLVETSYGRPYTKDHEVMLAFTRGILKAYFVNEKLVFFSDRWNDNIEDIRLQYKDTKGNTQYYVFDKDNSYSKLISIDDVSMSPTDTVYVLRKGRVEDCPDMIDFDPFVLSRVKSYSAGFVNAIERRYGYSTETSEQEVAFEEFITNVKELEFDYDIETFEDVLYCPKLEKLIIGKNRYFGESDYANNTDNPSQLLGSSEKSEQILDKAHELLGLTIDYYGHESWNSHYFEDPLIYMEYKGYPVLPDMEVIGPDAFKVWDEEGNKISCTPSDPYAVLNNLLDDNNGTVWVTTSYGTPRTYELLMELNEPTEIRGVKVRQPAFGMWDSGISNFVPSSITIETSVNGTEWKAVTFFSENELGQAASEITLLPVVEGLRKVRYVKVSLRDGVDTGGNCKINLGDIVLYK